MNFLYLDVYGKRSTFFYLYPSPKMGLNNLSPGDIYEEFKIT